MPEYRVELSMSQDALKEIVRFIEHHTGEKKNKKWREQYDKKRRLLVR